MYAVIVSGGKQYRVQEGQTIKLEMREEEIGVNIKFDKILMVVNGDDIKVGNPLLKATVAADVISHGRHKKVRIMKFKRRKHHQKQMGHRQYFTEVKITRIAAG